MIVNYNVLLVLKLPRQRFNYYDGSVVIQIAEHLLDWPLIQYLRMSVSSVTRCWNKKLPKFSKICQKSSHCTVLFKQRCFPNNPKVTKYLGYFCYKISGQELSIIAQSGHTSVSNTPNIFLAKQFSPNQFRMLAQQNPNTRKIIPQSDTNIWEVVVAQLVERLLPILEVCGSNPVIGKILFISNICLLSTVY